MIHFNTEITDNIAGMRMEKLTSPNSFLLDKSDAFYSLLDLLLVIEPKLTFVLPAYFNVKKDDSI